jgi:hypothetical protein
VAIISFVFPLPEGTIDQRMAIKNGDIMFVSSVWFVEVVNIVRPSLLD